MYLVPTTVNAQRKLWLFSVIIQGGRGESLGCMELPPGSDNNFPFKKKDTLDKDGSFPSLPMKRACATKLDPLVTNILNG